MSARRKRGPIAKYIKSLCISLCLSKCSEIEFTEAIKTLIQERIDLGEVLLQDIALALRRSALEYCEDDVERIWKLADGADVRIRRAWENYRGKFLGGQ